MKTFKIEILEDGEHLVYFELFADDGEDFSRKVEALLMEFDKKDKVTVRAIEEN